MTLFKKSLLVAAMGAFLGGCSTPGAQKIMDENPKKAEIVIQELNEVVSKLDITNVERSYIEYRIIPERDDLNSINKKLKQKVEDTKVSDAHLHDILAELAGELNVGIVFQVESAASLKRKISVNTNKTSVRDYLKIIENTANIDIYFVGNNMVVSDTMAISGNFGKLEADGGQVYSKLRDYLKEVLTRQGQSVYEPVKIGNGIDAILQELSEVEDEDVKAKVDDKKRESAIAKINQVRSDISSSGDAVDIQFEPIVVVDEVTGAFFIKTEPNLLRRSQGLIENVINSSLSYAMVQMDVYQINDTKAKRFGVSAEKVVDNLYRMSLGVTPGIASTATAGLSYARQDMDGNDMLKLGIEAYEQSGVIRGETNTILTVFNGVETNQSDLKEVGYWVPGDLQENTNSVDGVVVTTYTESRPTYESSEVGKELTVMPRIDLDSSTMNMKVTFKDSKVYAYDTFGWQRNTMNGDVVELKNPLKMKNEIEGVVFVKSGDYAVLSGTQTRDGSLNREGIPETSDGPFRDLGGVTSEGSSKTNSLMVIKPIFPTKKEVTLVEKVKAI